MSFRHVLSLFRDVLDRTAQRPLHSRREGKPIWFSPSNPIPDRRCLAIASSPRIELIVAQAARVIFAKGASAAPSALPARGKTYLVFPFEPNPDRRFVAIASSPRIDSLLLRRSWRRCATGDWLRIRRRFPCCLESTLALRVFERTRA